MGWNWLEQSKRNIRGDVALAAAGLMAVLAKAYHQDAVQLE